MHFASPEKSITNVKINISYTIEKQVIIFVSNISNVATFNSIFEEFNQ